MTSRDYTHSGHDVASDPATPFEKVIALLQDARPTTKGVRARCPAHEDTTPSLDVDQGDDGRVLLTCRSARCSPESIVTSLGLQMRDLFPRGNRTHRPQTAPVKAKKELKRHRTADRAVGAAHWSATNGAKDGKVTRYVYQDAKAEDVGIVVRIDFDNGRRKEIRRVSRDGNAWLCRDMPSPKPMYRLPALMAAHPDALVLIVEGEKCSDALEALEFVATTSCGGANAPLADTDWSSLTGHPVVILPDNDPPGQAYCSGVATHARAVGAASVSVLHLDGLAKGEDVFDWAEAKRANGHERAQVIAELRALIATAKTAPEEQPEPEEPNETEGQSGPELIELGQRDPATGRLVLSPKKTLPTAEAYLREFHSHPDGPTLHDYGGTLWEWKGNKYVEVEKGHVDKQLHIWLHRALRYAWNKKYQVLELVDFDGNPGSVKSALDTVCAIAHLPVTTPAPSWIGTNNPPHPVHEMMPCKTSNLHIPSGRTLAATPRLFAFNAIDFDYDQYAPDPKRWLAFLDEVFGDDKDSINLLQEWFGYCLTADTGQHKMLLIVGPRRSGKGTLGRVLTQLVGCGNVVGPTVGGLAGNFGLQPLLGKTLAVVSDARFSGDTVMTVVERLLCISGEDSVTVDRKFLASVTLKLPIKFVFLTNELPRFNDSSTALAGRFLVLRMTRSFYGKEDVGLTDALMAELPGILLWALFGWERLHSRGRFLEPESSREAITDIEDLSSPVNAFVRDRCVLGPGHRTIVDTLYQAWQTWCAAEGRTSCTTKNMFGRDLGAAVAGIKRRRSTGMAAFYDGIGLRSGENP